jgi:hypothetical protein
MSHSFAPRFNSNLNWTQPQYSRLALLAYTNNRRGARHRHTTQEPIA